MSHLLSFSKKNGGNNDSKCEEKMYHLNPVHCPYFFGLMRQKKWFMDFYQWLILATQGYCYM